MPRRSAPIKVETFSTEDLKEIQRLVNEEIIYRFAQDEFTNATIVLTPDDKKLIDYMATGLEMSKRELTTEVLQLRTSPRTVTLTARDQQTIHLAQVVKVHKGHGQGILLSNGAVARDLPNPNRWDRGADRALAVSEWVEVDTPTSRPSQEQWKLPIANGIVRRLQTWPIPLQPEVLRIALARGADNDFPQEVLMHFFVEQVYRYYSQLRDTNELAYYLMGVKPNTLTLRTLLTERLTQIREGRSLTIVPVKGSYYNDWTQPILDAVDSFLIDSNLLDGDLLADDTLHVEIAEMLASQVARAQQAETKGAKLRDAIAQKFGWAVCRLNASEDRYHHDYVDAWVASTSPRMAFLRAERIKGASHVLTFHHLKTEFAPSVLITEKGRIYVNGEYRCVVEAISARLPESDQIARRMLTLSTTHRNAINTLDKDREMLEAIFPPNAQSIWDIRAAADK